VYFNILRRQVIISAFQDLQQNKLASSNVLVN